MRQFLQLVEGPPADPRTETDAFRAWFGESKIVDRQGRPLVVYHGAPDTRFIWAHGFKTHAEQYGQADTTVRGFFFAKDRRVAQTYADPHRAWDYQNAEEGVIDVYLRMENPKLVDGKGEVWRNTEPTITAAHAEGHDGVIIQNTSDNYQAGHDGKKHTTTVYVVFTAKQIKAVRNTGAFDRNSPKIQENRTSLRSFINLIRSK